jgi:hypothetical protein
MKNLSSPEISRQSRLQELLGYLFAALCLVWVFYDLQPQKLLASIRIAHWAWLLPAVFFDVLTYLLQGLRWTLLLAPVGRMRPIKATQAIYAALFMNEVVPLRLGEVARAFLVSRWLNAPMTRVIPSIVAERFLDALFLAVGVGLAGMFVPLPRKLVDAWKILGAVVILAACFLVVIIIRREKKLETEAPHLQPASPHGFRARASAMLQSLAHGLQEIGLSSRLYAAAALSVAMLACQGVAVWSVMRGYGFDLPIAAGGVVMIVVRLGTAIPNAPANVGSFQFFTVLALGLFGMEKTEAAAFSIVDFAVLTLPLWTLGLLSLARTGMSLASLRREIGRLQLSRTD